MDRKRRAWIFLPAVIVAIAAIGLVISSFQKEVGLVAPGENGRAAVAAAMEAQRALSPTEGASGYSEFSTALLAAGLAYKNMPVTNPADTRLDGLLDSILDCLSAAREAWQAELDGTWDPRTHGRSTYWRALHPSLEFSENDALSSADVRGLCGSHAAELLKEAIDLAG